jgi:PAS domain S-box-containing protein
MPANKIKELQQKIEFFERILDNIRNGVMITDPEGRIIFFSEAYGNFLGIDPQKTLGKNCQEVVENSRMHIVAETGIPEINQPHRVKGKDMVVQRIPIKKGGKVIAVYGQVMFEDVQDVQDLAKKLTLLESKVELYEKELENLRASKYTFRNIIGKSGTMVELKKMALKAAKTNAPVLIVGESGTGKELFAHAVHHASQRRPFPFVRLNCAAIPKDLLEAELFGYEPGAFTGAGGKGKPGKFELAQGGTIFLDEIGDLPLSMQPKLLRVIEEKEIERLGSTRLRYSDFRLITATHANLEKRVEKGQFRKDLFYRLNVIPLMIPPLRERREDIPLLTEHLIQRLNAELGMNVIRIQTQALECFRRYHWPGNVRELTNILERVMYSMDEDTIKGDHLPIFLQTLGRGAEKIASVSLRKMRQDMEKEVILQAIRLAKNNKNRASQLLGIHRTALYKKLKKLNLPLSQAVEWETM